MDREQAKQGYLSEVDIFRDLAPEEIAALGRRAPMRTVPAGAVIYTPDEAGEVLFILKVGRVRLYRLSPDGNAFTMAIVESGTIFGEMALLGQVMRDSHAEALAPCVLCLMSRADVQTLLLGDPQIALRITETLGRRLLDAEQRLAALLVALAERQPPRLFRPGQREVRLTHEQLADLVGTRRETATKVLNALRVAGLIELRRGRVLVLDVAALRAWGGD